MGDQVSHWKLSEIKWNLELSFVRLQNATSFERQFWNEELRFEFLMYILPGKTKTKTAARAPRNEITTPILGVNTASTKEAANQTDVTRILRRNSPDTTSSGGNLRMASHTLSKADLMRREDNDNVNWEIVQMEIHLQRLTGPQRWEWGK